MALEHLTVEDHIPPWAEDLGRRMATVEHELKTLKYLWVLHDYAVRLPPDAERDDRIRQGGSPWTGASGPAHPSKR